MRRDGKVNGAAGDLQFQVLTCGADQIPFESEECPQDSLRPIRFQLDGERRFFISVITRAPAARRIRVAAYEGEIGIAFEQSDSDLEIFGSMQQMERF